MRIKFILYPNINVSFKIDKLIYSNDNYNLSNISDDNFWIRIEPKKTSEYVWCTPFLTLNNSEEIYFLGTNISGFHDLIKIDDVSLQTYTGSSFYVYDKITQTLTIDTLV